MGFITNLTTIKCQLFTQSCVHNKNTANVEKNLCFAVASEYINNSQTGEQEEAEEEHKQALLIIELPSHTRVWFQYQNTIFAVLPLH